MEQEDDPYNFDDKFDNIDKQIENKKKIAEQVNEEDYFTLGQNEQKIINEVPKQSVYAESNLSNQGVKIDSGTP